MASSADVSHGQSSANVGGGGVGGIGGEHAASTAHSELDGEHGGWEDAGSAGLDTSGENAGQYDSDMIFKAPSAMPTPDTMNGLGRETTGSPFGMSSLPSSSDALAGSHAAPFSSFPPLLGRGDSSSPAAQSGAAASAPSAAPAAAAAAAAAPLPIVAPVIKPILRGTIMQLASAANPRTLQWSGKWAMVEREGELSADFAYVFSVPDAYGLPMLHDTPAGAAPILPILPSEPVHPVAAAPFSGAYFIWQGNNEDGSPKWGRQEEGGDASSKSSSKVPLAIQAQQQAQLMNPGASSRICVIRIGGAPNPSAPVITDPVSGAPIPASATVNLSGGGWNSALKKRYALVGAFHPPSGMAWAYKVFDTPHAAPGGPKAAGGATAGGKRPRSMGDIKADAMLLEQRERRQPAPFKSSSTVAPRSLRPVAAAGGPNGAALYDMLETLKRDYNAPDFLQPVDPVVLNLPDYAKIVTSPMDLSTIEGKLEKGDFSGPNGPLDFKADVEKMFSNALLYNGPDKPVGQRAIALGQVFTKKWEAWAAKKAATEASEASAAAAAAAAEDASGRGRPSLGGGKAVKGGKSGGGKSTAASSEDEGDNTDAEESAGGKGKAAGGAKRGRKPAVKAPSSSSAAAVAAPAPSSSSSGASAAETTAMMQEKISQLTETVRMFVELQSKLVMAQTAGLASSAMAGGVPGMGSILTQEQAQKTLQALQSQTAPSFPMLPASVPASMAAPAPAKAKPGRKSVGASGGGAKKPPAKPSASAASAADDDDDGMFNYISDDGDEDYKKTKPRKSSGVGGAAAKGRRSSAAAPLSSSSFSSSSSSSSLGNGGGAPPLQAAPLTYEEKKALSLDVALLTPSQVDEVMKIITEFTPVDAAGAAGGEVELDMDSLPPITLRELQRYVAQCLGRPVPGSSSSGGSAPPPASSSSSAPRGGPGRPSGSGSGMSAADRQAALGAQAARVAAENAARIGGGGGGGGRGWGSDDFAPPPPPGF